MALTSSDRWLCHIIIITISRDYNESVASLRMIIPKDRIWVINTQEVNLDYQPTGFVKRKALLQMIYKSLDHVFAITKEQYDQVLKSNPLLSEWYSAIQESYKIIYPKRDDRIEKWLIKLEKFDIPELHTYINWIRNDLDAVKNGMKYNNGLAEGSANKIKVIKRIMYG